MARDFPPTSQRLDELRLMGDPEADDFVREHFKPETVRPLMEALVERREVARYDVFRLSEDEPQDIAINLQDLFDDTAATMPDVTENDIEIAQDLFSQYGPEILMILGCYCLPAAYSARKGVQVLATTKFLRLEPDRRLAETAQIIVDVMSEGLALGEGGREAAERTRLIHAAIRRLVSEDPNFDATEVGVPINQEDLAATLMTFSYLVLDGLDKMNMRVTPRQQEAYIDTWRQLGRLLGVEEELLPDDFAEAERLTETIQERQIKASPEGIQLLNILIKTLEAKTFDGLPSVMMRLFLPADVADGMEVPRNALPLIPDWAVHWMIKTVGYVDSWFLGILGKRSMILRDVSLDLLEGVMGWQLSNRGSKPKFVLPDSLDWYQERDGQKREKASRILLDTALAGAKQGADARRKRAKTRDRRKEQTGG